MRGSGSGLWRVYREEWTVAHVSAADGSAQECSDWFTAHFEEAVGSADWRVVPWSQEDPGGWPWMLELRLPVLKGEYLSRDVAEGVAVRIGGDLAREGSEKDLQLQRRGDILMRKA